MGKSAPTPPPAPDPATLIGAASQANQQAALQQSALNNVNYQGPQGQTTYSMESPGRWTESVALNPTAQATYDMAGLDQYHAAKLAGTQLGVVQDALQQGLQPQTLQTSVQTPGLQTGYGSGGAVAYGFNPGGPIQGQVQPTYSPFVGQGGSSAPAEPHAGMHYDQSSGWIPTSAYGTDTSGAHPGMMYDPSAGWVQADSRAVGVQPQGVRPGAGAPSGAPSSPYASIASNPVAATQLAEYGQARQLLDPQWRQAAEQQNAQLIAQGLNPNDAAWQNQQAIFGNQRAQAYNDALFGAIGAGNAEQNTLYGQNLQSGQFANSAQAQQYGENQGQAAFNNTAQQQANSQNAAAAGFYNAAAGQGFGQNLQAGQFANQAAQQQFQSQAYAQELPVNEFTALMGNTQVAPPPSAPAQNTTVAPANALAAYQMNQNALQNAYSAQLQNYHSGLDGLFGLGSAALKTLGPFVGI